MKYAKTKVGCHKKRKSLYIVTVTMFKEYLIVTATMFKEYRIVTVTICLTSSRVYMPIY
jgi:hypothetical protein